MVYRNWWFQAPSLLALTVSSFNTKNNNNCNGFIRIVICLYFIARSCDKTWKIPFFGRSGGWISWYLKITAFAETPKLQAIAKYRNRKNCGPVFEGNILELWPDLKELRIISWGGRLVSLSLQGCKLTKLWLEQNCLFNISAELHHDLSK